MNNSYQLKIEQSINRSTMFNKAVVLKALKKCWALDFNPKWKPSNPTVDQDSVTSLMLYDIFGGEILKTPKPLKKGWHFYNRIDGKRFDFTKSKIGNLSLFNRFEDINASPEEVCNYFETEDYLTLRRRFIRAYEEAIGLKKYQYSVS